jgi:membrane protein insertase Oxa1/YidC/SpoIIIJ
MVIPVLVFLTSFFSTKITRKFSGSAQQTDANGNPVGGGFFMEVGMPLISAIFAYSMPAAIGAYWVWRTILSVGQTLIFAKVMPIPAVTEEMIAEAKLNVEIALADGKRQFDKLNEAYKSDYVRWKRLKAEIQELEAQKQKLNGEK